MWAIHIGVASCHDGGDNAGPFRLNSSPLHAQAQACDSGLNFGGFYRSGIVGSSQM